MRRGAGVSAWCSRTIRTRAATVRGMRAGGSPVFSGGGRLRGKRIAVSRTMLDGDGHVPKVDAWSAPADVATAIVRECLREYAQVRLKVKGRCMAPAIVPGMTVVLREARMCPPKAGDVVLVRHAGGLRLHRLYVGPPFASKHRRWRTRGDRGFAWDPEIQPGGVLGTLAAVEGTALPDWRRGPWGLAWLALAGFLKAARARRRTRRIP